MKTLLQGGNLKLTEENAMSKKKLEIHEETSQKEQKPANHMALGMCFGVMGGSIAMSILSMFGQIAWGGLCVGIGLLVGMLIGMAIPKKK